MKWKIHKRELDYLSRVLGQRMARWLTRLPVILQRQDKQLICNNCKTSYVDNNIANTKASGYTCKWLRTVKHALPGVLIKYSSIYDQHMWHTSIYIKNLGVVFFFFFFTLALFGFMGVRDIINNTQWAYCSLLVFCHHRKPPKSNCNCKSSLDSALYWIH